MKSKAFENGFKSVACWKRIVTKTLRFWCEVVKTGAFENSDEKKSYIVSILTAFSLDL